MKSEKAESAECLRRMLWVFAYELARAQEKQATKIQSLREVITPPPPFQNKNIHQKLKRKRLKPQNTEPYL